MRFFAFASAAGCIAAGLWLLTTQPADSNSLFGPWMHGIGLYFIAKGLYVGPSLIAQADASRALKWLVDDQARQADEETT